MRRSLSITVLLLLSLTLALFAQSSGPVRVGDEVEVFFLGKWQTAKVIETNKRGDVLAEFEFAGHPKRQVFKRSEVRFAYEADAIVPGRSWSDKSGQFKTRAALLRLDEGSVTLRKEDMKELKIAIDKLSDADQAFLKRLQKEIGPASARPPAPPPIEKFERSSVAKIDTAAPAFGSRSALTADPLPSSLRMQEGGFAFPIGGVFERLGAVLALGGADSWILAAVESGHANAMEASKLLWVTLGKREIGGQQLLPPGEIVLDYHPASHRLLTYAELPGASTFERQRVLSLWEVLPADKQVKPVARWNVEPDERPTRDPWGRLVTPDLVLHRWKDHEYVAWDIAGKQLRYQIAQESFFAPLPTISGGRKYLFLPEDKGVKVFETATGKMLTMLPSEDGATGVALTEDGRRAAVLGRSTLTIWDLADTSAAPQRIQSEAIGSPFGAKLHWVDDQHLMADAGGDQVLFSLQHKLALWSYHFDGNAVRESNGRRLRDIVGGHLVYAASVQAGAERGLAVGAVKLPGPKVMEAAASLNIDDLMIVKPGTSVRVEVRAGAENARIQSLLERQIQANGWKLSPSAKVVVIAEMRQGETQTVTYRSFGFGGEESVTITPYISEVRVEADGKNAWHSMTSSGVPPSLRLPEGQSVQSEVDKWQKPNPQFFDTVTLPAKIFDPAKRNGIGLTNVTNRGLIAQ
jgi:hypothetical protein